MDVRKEIYEQTIKRLARGGINDPTSQIIALAEEIERYREKIYGLEALLRVDDRHPNEKTDFIGRTWFPKLDDWRGFIEWIEQKRREGWEPHKWEYKPATPTDYSWLTFILKREV